MTDATSPSPTESFAQIIGIVCHLIRTWFAGGRELWPLMRLTIARARRAERRFQALIALIAMIEAGTLHSPRPHMSPSERKPAAPRPARVPGRAIDRLRPLIRYNAGAVAYWGSRLQSLLATAETRALIAAEPERMGRLLRPICRTLGVAVPETLRLPPRPRPRPRPRSCKPHPRKPCPRRAASRAPAEPLEHADTIAGPRRATFRARRGRLMIQLSEGVSVPVAVSKNRG
jgi:hypothetical protein